MARSKLKHSLVNHYPIIESVKQNDIANINNNNLKIIKNMKKINYTHHSRIDDNDVKKIYNGTTVIAIRRKGININNTGFFI